jgi:hypothetical protein
MYSCLFVFRRRASADNGKPATDDDDDAYDVMTRTYLSITSQ